MGRLLPHLDGIEVSEITEACSTGSNPYLTERIASGCFKASVLHREVVVQGFTAATAWSARSSSNTEHDQASELASTCSANESCSATQIGDDHLVTSEEFTVSDLTGEERYVLARGLAEWGGPAHCTDALAVAMDFESAAVLLEEARRLKPLISDGQPLSRRDWRRVLVSTEIVFASDVFGSGCDWSITTGLSDEDTIHILRSIQRKIARAAKIHQQ